MKTEASENMNRTDKEQFGESQFEDSRLDRVLVVISPDLVRPDAPMESKLITRAIELAKATGCELEFLHICYDDSLSSTFFAERRDLLSAQAERLGRDATLMAEMIVRLRGEGVTIHQDTRWDSPRTDAILRKIRESKPDLVMKQSRDCGYFMGLMNNTDWDLIRQAPAHLWFVTGEGDARIERLITAVGAGSDEDNVLFSGADYDVFRIGKLIADGFKAENFPVHAYQVPRGLSTYSAYAPEFVGGAYPVAGSVSIEQTQREIARKHGRSIEAFAKCLNMDPERVRLAEGHPSDVLLANAKELEANLIVMAAQNLSRWERVFRSVTAEPVLADAPCDVVFIKDTRDAPALRSSTAPAQGTPAWDLEQAVMDPQRTFTSPQKLAEASEISVPMRQRILEIWEQDIRAQMAEESEGGSVQTTNADVLDAINSATAHLAAEADCDADEAVMLTR